MGRFVRILKPAPAADVINQNGFVSWVAAHDVLQELLETFSPFENDAGLGTVSIGLDNAKTVQVRVGLHRQLLIIE